MLKDALIIFRKEVKNLFKDRRTLFSTFILPLLVLPIIFIGMGTVLGSMEKDAQESTYAISITGNRDPVFSDLLAGSLSYVPVDRQAAEISIVFPVDYAPGVAANVVVSYDSSSRKNQFAAQQVVQVVKDYESVLAQDLLSLYGLDRKDLHTLDIVMVDVASEATRTGGSVLAMLVPYFLVIFLFAGSMNAGLDTTSGEKERGSLAVLLVNQVSRTSIAWGKILYVSLVAICSAIATFLGLLISMYLPVGSSAMMGPDLKAFVIGGHVLAMIVATLLSTALLTASVVSLLGCIARTMKEGSSYVMPLYMVVILVGVTTMYMDPTQRVVLFLVPVVNTIFMMKESFMGMATAGHLVLTVVSNISFATVCALMVSRLFNSEKILQTV